MFSTRRSRDFSDRLFASNRTLYNQVDISGALFTHKTYPPQPSEAPFVLFHLREAGTRVYQLLASLIASEAQRRKLDWHMSGSFGFRTERFETILPREQMRVGERPQGVLKVACGSYRGARFWAIVDLINELARFDSMADVAKSWGRGR